MANQKQNGRNTISNEPHRPSWRMQDQGMRDDDRGRWTRDRDDEDYVPDRGRSMRGGYEDDRDEGYRSFDRSHDRPHDRSYDRSYDRSHDRSYDRSMDRPIERYGQGQSGYGAGRYGDDRSLGFQNRNPVEGFGRQDEGFGQRGFGGAERMGYNTGYNQSGSGFGGYGEQTGYGRGFEGQGREARGQRGLEEGYRSFESRGQGYAPQGYGPQGYGPQGYGDPGFGPQGYGQQFGQGYLGEGYREQGSREQGYGQGTGQQNTRQQSYGPQSYGPQSYGQGPLGGQRGYGFQQGGHRGKGPQGYTRSDERIRETVCEVLHDDDQIDATNIDVTVKSGEVVLSGSVSDRRMKRLAEDCVERLPGVKDVQNQIKVTSEQQQGRTGTTQSSQIGNGAIGRTDTDTSSDKRHRA